MLGEELGHRREVGAADLATGLVDLLLPLGLPELVDPAQGVVGGEHLGRQLGEDPLEPRPVLRREAHLVGRVVGPEDAGQHGGGIPRREHPLILLPLLGGELGDLGHLDRGPAGMDEELVLGEEPGEQHPVPLLVSNFFD